MNEFCCLAVVPPEIQTFEISAQQLATTIHAFYISTSLFEVQRAWHKCCSRRILQSRQSSCLSFFCCRWNLPRKIRHVSSLWQYFESITWSSRLLAVLVVIICFLFEIKIFKLFVGLLVLWNKLSIHRTDYRVYAYSIQRLYCSFSENIVCKRKISSRANHPECQGPFWQAWLLGSVCQHIQDFLLQLHWDWCSCTLHFGFVVGVYGPHLIVCCNLESRPSAWVCQEWHIYPSMLQCTSSSTYYNIQKSKTEI